MEENSITINGVKHILTEFNNEVGCTKCSLKELCHKLDSFCLADDIFNMEGKGFYRFKKV